MRLSNLLLQESRQELRDETSTEIAELLRRNCSQSLAAAPIYRTDNGLSGKVYFANPSEYKRRSANTENYYTEIMDMDPAWSNWPSRSRSLICSAARPDRTFRALFFDNANIGVCPDEDLWWSFPRLGASIGICSLLEFGKALEMMSNKIDANYIGARGGNPPLSDDTQSLNTFFDRFEEWAKEDFDRFRNTVYDPDDKFYTSDRRLFYYAMDKFGGDLRAALYDLFNPHKNGFERKSIGNFDIKTNREVWSDSKAYLIDTTFFANMAMRHGL